jgi:hypothetical protein
MSCVGAYGASTQTDRPMPSLLASPSMQSGDLGVDASAQLERLVDDFSGAEVVREATFKEDWTRSEFIEPLFRLLGWDRVNPATIDLDPGVALTVS